MDSSPPQPSASGGRAQGLAARPLAEWILAGGAAIFPTDTLPALAALPTAAEQIWALKARPSSKPLILMGAEPEALFAALELPPLPRWLELAECYWPGALTLVLPARGAVVAALQPGVVAAEARLGLRIPACERARELLRHTGPLATTSANRSGDTPCLTAAAAAAAFPHLPRLAPQPWPPASGEASTVLAWSSAGTWQLLRSGAVMLDQDLLRP
jgi:L-threonylcarbamoyladenylate synthase